MSKPLAQKGKINYFKGVSQDDRHCWGFEEWRITPHADGSRTLNAHCELHDDPLIIRDVIQSIDANRQPTDALVRLAVNGAFQGAALYTFGNGEATCHGVNRTTNYFMDQRDIPPAIRGFGTHALMADGWLTAHFDRSEGPGAKEFRNNLLTSLDHQGGTGPDFQVTTFSHMQYFGDETVSVLAGRFDCHHFAIIGASNNHPQYDFWVTADEEFVYVKGAVPEEYGWSFELAEYDTLESGVRS